MTARPAALAAALLPLAAPATNAVVGSAELARAEAAVGTPYSWGTFPAVGYCGLTHGNVVKWWQTILWADGLLSATGDQQVDGVFGQNTKVATMKWQQQHSLGTSQVDGCAGVNTYWHAQAHLNYVGQAAHVFENSVWKYPGTQHSVTYEWVEAYEFDAQVFHWEVWWNPGFWVT